MSDIKRQKVAILGGSFDPATNAHLEIIRNLSKKFSRVVVLPCYISPFKQDGCAASGEDRVKMLRKVTTDLENVKVSKWEIKQEKVSYTVDAVKHYEQKYEGAELFFVIGSDCLQGLAEWKDADYLAEHVTFLLIRRAGFPVRKATLDLLKELGFRFKSAGFTAGDDSSALVRAAVAFGKEGNYVPKEIAEHMQKHALYGDYAKYAAAYKTFGLKTERIEHTFRAVKAGIYLAKMYDENVRAVTVALMLHDIGKYATPAVLKEKKVSVPNYDALAASAPPLLHAYVSAAIARDYFGCDEKIVDAVAKHTTGSYQMTTLDKIVYLADAVEEGRDYEGVDKIRKLAAKDLDKAMLRTLKATVKSLKADGRPVCGETIEAVRHFTNVCRAATAAKKAAPVFQTAVEKPIEQVKTNTVTAEQLKSGGGRALAVFIAGCLSQKKGRQIAIIDVAKKTVIADCFVIAGATSTTAVKAMADYVDERLSKDYGIEPLRRDISPKWAVLDYGDVIVHIQHNEAREFYRLEKLWDEGDNITYYRD